MQSRTECFDRFAAATVVPLVKQARKTNANIPGMIVEWSSRNELRDEQILLFVSWNLFKNVFTFPQAKKNFSENAYFWGVQANNICETIERDVQQWCSSTKSLLADGQ